MLDMNIYFHNARNNIANMEHLQWKTKPIKILKENHDAITPE